MKTFLTYLDENDNLNPLFPYGGSSTGPGMGQYVPVADLNAQSEKELKKSDLDQVEKYADRIFASLGNNKQIKKSDVDQLEKYADRLFGSVTLMWNLQDIFLIEK